MRLTPELALGLISNSHVNTEFQQKVIADLEQAGFAAEMRAIRAFLRSKVWKCSGLFGYLDRDENKPRQVDLHASSILADGPEDKLDIICICFIVGEVKKSDKGKPWVVFKERYPENGLMRPRYISYSRDLPLRDAEVSALLEKRSLGKIVGWVGAGIHESFKSPNNPSRWYGALVSVAKAAESFFSDNEPTSRQSQSQSSGAVVSDPGNVAAGAPIFAYVQPVVVLDGPLLSAELTDDDDVKVEAVNFAPMRFFYRSEQYTREYYDIDIVRLNALEKYIEYATKRHVEVFETIMERSHPGRTPFYKNSESANPREDAEA